MKNDVMCIIKIGILLLSLSSLMGCDHAAETPETEPVATPCASVSSLPSPTPMHTPSPTPSLSPTPAPLIDAEWYRQRNLALRSWMEAYGNYDSQASIEEKLLRMQIDPNKPMVALTFDDGPVAGVTDEIVDILSAYDARATFFVRGGRCKFDETPDLLKKILGAGSEIGNHTWKHEILTSTNTKQMMNSIRRCNEDVFNATGYQISLLRPPGGKSSPEVCRVAKKYGLAVVLWAQSGNVHEQVPEKIAENVRRQIVNGKELADGDIILLHDTKAHMVEAVKLIVPELQQMGYQLVTASELIHLSDRGFVPGEEYRNRFE